MTTQPTGLAALTFLEKTNKKFDVIITDYSMPGISGLEFAKSALSLFPGTFIIMMSGNVDKKMLEGCKQLGIKHVLQKPWTEASLLKNILNHE